MEMSKIPAHVFDCICKLFKEETKEKLFNHLYKSPADAPKDWFENYVHTILDKYFSGELFDPSEIRNTFYRKRQLNKKNWVKSLKRDIEEKKPNPIANEIEIYRHLLSTQRNKQQQLKEILPVKQLEDLYEYRLNELEQWAKDKNSLLTDYIYLSYQKPYQIQRAFEADFVFIISDYFKERGYNGQWSKAILPRPYGLIEIPWADAPHVIKSNIKQSGTDIVLYNDYKVGDNLLIRSMFSVKPHERVYFKNTYALDDVDSKIIEYVLENRDTSFYSDEKSVTIDLRKLGKLLYNSDGGKSIELVKQRIRKIARYSQEYIIVDKSNKKINAEYIINIFQEVGFDEETQLAHIVFSDRIHQNIINNQIVQVYKDVTEKLTNPTARTLIYALQKERIDSYIHQTSYTRDFDYFYFMKKIRFRSKKIEQNLKVIENALKEFQDLNVLVHSFKRNGIGFTIEFIPLTENERKDYFRSAPSLLQMPVPAIEGAER
jgi:hypothetical protein